LKEFTDEILIEHVVPFPHSHMHIIFT